MHQSREKRKEFKRKKPKLNPIGRKIARGGWISPLALSAGHRSSDPQVHRDGVRSSDRAFLNVGRHESFELLCWTAKQERETLQSSGMKIPSSLASTLSQLGVDASMWADLVWRGRKYFGRSSCVRNPTSMKEDAAKHGRPEHRGQAAAAACFAGG